MSLTNKVHHRKPAIEYGNLEHITWQIKQWLQMTVWQKWVAPTVNNHS